MVFADVADVLQEGGEGGGVGGGDVDADEDAAVVRAVVAVVEEGDVPAALHVVEEVAQRAGAFGEFEADEAFVPHFVAAPAHHVADVDFGDFVFGKVGVGQAGGGEFRAMVRRSAAPVVWMPTKMWAAASSP